ncbi:hypothetical protein F5Y00DRAFT_272545 [Daldinia vernicosa]|uniref:uncharacterized protein n=1 Tax=Daldinia vernicosa TaxID=114800 RepID=UPI002007DFB2|nr:uncharacterized protein F5Y00DRAFT_272545 [Daldinia vernicosa]KAI0853000.1 hypothetical protein F5Y00DRAFT_272545 [Daldinia vernicosa]
MVPVYSGLALSWTERLQSGRRFGKYDFGRFERLEGSSHYLGKGKIGDVEVACKFLFRESRWGVLTPEKNPGGIIYLDLSFTEPLDCRLKNAIVSLTLDEEDEDLQRYGNSSAKITVHIIEHGPKNLYGELDSASKITKHSFNPHVEVGGIFGAGGVGRDSMKQYIHRSQWKFSSSSTPNKLARPTILEWRLLESNLDSQLRYDNTFHTAFAFEHDGVTHAFKKFKFPVKPQFATTMVDFGGRKNLFQYPLDELAKNIPSEMDKKNAKLVQVPKNSSGANLSYEILEAAEPGDEQEDNQFNYDLPPITCSLGSSESVELQDLKRVSSALLSLREPITRQSTSAPKLEIPSPAMDQHSESTSREPSSLNGRVKTSANLDNPPGQKHDEVDRSITVIKSHTSHEEFEKLIRDTALPKVSQLIILWILTIGLRLSPSARKDVQTSGEKS